MWAYEWNLCGHRGAHSQGMLKLSLELSKTWELSSGDFDTYHFLLDGLHLSMDLLNNCLQLYPR